MTNCNARIVFNCEHLTTTPLRPKKLCRSETNAKRLATFREWKVKSNSYIPATKLSAAGFSYTGKSDKVKCSFCDLEIMNWKSNMDPLYEHCSKSPNCSFVQHLLDEVPMKNDATTKTELSNENTQETDTTVANVNTASSKVFHFLSNLTKGTLESARRYTFLNWPSITPSVDEMVNAGWWYTNINDRVICVFCDKICHRWTDKDQPYDIHRTVSPSCPFIVNNEKYFMREHGAQNSINSNVGIDVTAKDNSTECGENKSSPQATARIMHPMYSSYHNRHTSFYKLPENTMTQLPSIESFVHAGFFYTGEQTIVRCFYCNGALKNWQPNDDPKIEHARWFPHCIYIRQFIGENLYQAVLRKNRELRALQANAVHVGSKVDPWSKEELEQMISARIDLPIVRSLLDAGFKKPLINKVFEMQLRFKKDDFKSDVDLRIACVILQKQIQIINGDESKVMVPSIIYSLNTSRKAANDLDLENKKTICKTTVGHSKDDEKLCLVCHVHERHIACLPCGHWNSCLECGPKLQKCPKCMGSVRGYIRLYSP